MGLDIPREARLLGAPGIERVPADEVAPRPRLMARAVEQQEPRGSSATARRDACGIA